MADLFISYARADDEPFVKRLYEDLTARGFDVWWDREAMESRGRTFLQEIRNAIASVDRLILVVGPEALQSEVVRAEWEFALSVCKVIIPILRRGDYALLPPELSSIHCPDFRSTRPYEDALAELVRLMDDPVPPLGTLYGVDAVPEHFVPRPEAMDQVSASVLADVSHPTVITSAKRTAALQGMGGVGKSVLAAAFACACETRRVFLDGILWVRVGQHPDIPARLRLAGQALGDDVLQHYLDPQSGATRLSQLLADKVCLLVLDDVWDVAHTEPFANALGPRCRLLITTRDGGLATALGAQENRLDVLNDEQAMALLAKWADQDMETLPPQARDVADECGNLPLALAMIGATVRGKPSRWANALHKLRNADLEKIRRQFPNYPYPDLLRAIQVSVETLDPDVEACYLDFAVFPEDTPIPETALQVLWKPEGLDEYDTQDVLDMLVERSLLGRDEDGHLTLHDLQVDYVRRQHAELPALHNRLLDAYAAQCPDGWPSGPSDGYFFENLAYHLVEAGRGDELRALLLEFDWLWAKLAATDVVALMADYEVPAADPDLASVQDALSLSAHALAADKTQLPTQLTGRLMGHTATAVQKLVAGARGWRGSAWLRPLAPNLTPPGGSLLRTLAGHTSSVTAVAVYAVGRRAISASWDKTLKIWDLETGQVLRTLEGHTDAVEAVAVYADKRRAISASRDSTLKIWDMESGKELRTIEGHADHVGAVAIFADGRRVTIASPYETLNIWDLESETVLATFSGDSLFWRCDVAPDGRTVVAGDKSGRVHVLRLEEPG